MRIIPQPKTKLMVKLPQGVPVQDILSPTAILPDAAVKPMTARAAGNVGGGIWHEVTPPATAAHPWDAAHALALSAAALGGPVPFVEPAFVQSGTPWIALATAINASLDGTPVDLNPNWPPLPDENADFDWHLADEFSQLRSARQRVGDLATPRRVRIGHLDTGYCPQHETLPKNLLWQLGKNFADPGETSVVDPNSSQGFMATPGHGTATLAILAGNTCYLTNDFLGGAPFAEVVPMRIANSVVHLGGEAIGYAIEYAISIGCDVISMSMGGLPIQHWVDAVNDAYMAGCVMCFASGDSVGGFPTTNTIYPAWCGRAISCCGVTFAGQMYYDPKYNGRFDVLEGSFGPDPVMRHAISAYTPNVPWAAIGTQKGYSRSGGGTSAATPQVAAAAALYFQKNMADLLKLPGWQRVEAVRFALFSASSPADLSTLGVGTLRADDALDVPVNSTLPHTPPDTIDFALLKILFGWDGIALQRQNMLSVEAAQLVASSSKLSALMGDAAQNPDRMTADEKKSAVDALINAPGISDTLKRFLQNARAKM